MLAAVLQIIDNNMPKTSQQHHVEGSIYLSPADYMKFSLPYCKIKILNFGTVLLGDRMTVSWFKTSCKNNGNEANSVLWPLI